MGFDEFDDDGTVHSVAARSSDTAQRRPSGPPPVASKRTQRPPIGAPFSAPLTTKTAPSAVPDLSPAVSSDDEETVILSRRAAVDSLGTSGELASPTIRLPEPQLPSPFAKPPEPRASSASFAMDRPLPPDSSGTAFVALALIGLLVLGPIIHIPVLIAARNEKNTFVARGWRVPSTTQGAIVISMIGLVLWFLFVAAIVLLILALS